MNGFFEIIAEGAMLEAAVADKYLLTGINENNVTDYVSDKAFAAGQTIKKLYEKVMNAIDEVINKILNYKDEKMLGFAAKNFKKYKFDPAKKKVVFRVEIVHVDQLSAAVDLLAEMSSGKLKHSNVKNAADSIKDAPELDKDDKKEIEKELLKELEEKYFKAINTTRAAITINSINDISTATRKCFIEPENSIELNAELYGKAFDFITAKKESSVATLLKKLRNLKSDIKREYQYVLRVMAEETRSLSKNSDVDKTDIKNAKKAGKFGLRIAFNIAVATVIALMSVIRDGVKYCKIVSKAIASRGEKIKDSDKEEVKAENGSALSFLESAIAESELDLY